MSFGIGAVKSIPVRNEDAKVAVIRFVLFDVRFLCQSFRRTHTRNKCISIYGAVFPIFIRIQSENEKTVTQMRGDLVPLYYRKTSYKPRSSV